MIIITTYHFIVSSAYPSYNYVNLSHFTSIHAKKYVFGEEELTKKLQPLP